MAADADALTAVEYQCRDWQDLVNRLNNLTGDWVLRGQRESMWPLRTTLERHAPEDRPRRESERALRKEFQRRAHFYLEPQHAPQDKIEWLALMQHFGAPTRLLDFTRSPYVAAYFALEDQGSGPECAVIAIDRTWCAQAAGAVLGNVSNKGGAADQAVAQLLSDEDQTTQALVTAYLVTKNDKLFAAEVLGRTNAALMVIPVEPNRLSERLSIQQGTFLCPGDVDRSFVENLTAMAGWQKAVKKFTLEFRHRRRALEELRKMNITRASLFPGLDGFAQSFRNYLEREPRSDRNIRIAIEGLEMTAKDFRDADQALKSRPREERQ